MHHREQNQTTNQLGGFSCRPSDELVEVVRLPPHLAGHPYLQELYGTVEWSVRSVFAGYLGWFDGDTATLSPAPPDDRARGYVELAGGGGDGGSLEGGGVGDGGRSKSGDGGHF